MDTTSSRFYETILFYSSALFPFFWTAISKSFSIDYVRTLKFPEGESYFVSWFLLIPFFQILLSNGHFASVILIFLLIFENSIIGELDWSVDIFFISLALLVLFQLRGEDNLTLKMPFYYGVPIISILLQFIDQHRRENSIPEEIFILIFGVWDLTQMTFMLHFSFLEYYAVLVWTGVIIIAGMNFINKSPEFISFRCEEVLYVVHTGVVCTLGSLCLIAWILSVTIPIKVANSSDRFFSPMRKKVFNRGFFFTIVFVISILTVMVPSMKFVLTGKHPVLWIVEFLSIDSFKRSYLCLYWLCLIPIFIISAQLLATKSLWPKFCNRKLFHFLMILVIAPGIFVEDLLSFTILALGVAFCAFILLETFRVMVLVFSQNDDITFYYSLFVDVMDSKRLWISSNISLLVGCAIPVFLWACWRESEGPCKSTNKSVQNFYIQKPFHQDIEFVVYKSQNCMKHQELLQRLKPILPNLGWITVGVGDSFAAIVGSYCGKNKWKGTSRTVEGSCGMFISMTFVSLILLLLADNSLSVYDRMMILSSMKTLLPILITMVMTTLMEAFTCENDNLVLPLFSVAVYTAVILTTQ